jgi:hypothetical protein
MLTAHEQVIITLLVTRFQAGFFPGLFFNPEDGSNMFPRNIS